MRKMLSAILLTVALAGCASTAQYGSFVDNAPVAFNQTMATDTVKQLVKLYPPARSRIELKQATPDAFGLALVNDLRAQGYAVVEVKPAGANTSEPAASTSVVAAAGKSATQPPTSPLSGYPLRYVLDQFPDSNMYRVIVMVGSQSLTRAYVAQNNTVLPASAWVRKE
ncbi:hypothetical protein LMG31886_45350 (plasmid) [Xanthomonas hydrangeae]|uniref:lipoprotein n=1 Tax=Xanthomonas hydrangeae TaxID=2775159 RepID=UPI0019654238|nr:hypothetical protein LMG31884_48220 [Xanthomonas hydrangeae]CAD7741931.1 hypothetical protein LMG31884_48220 [Xanthomonas hydrangeae]CAD7748362.1 hypothetical protein LMG31886_45350 [Xanthomonas hydrangeae]CAD7748363.1 hypothetical protein LMG31886_45350 [Xanthomonas hydrangeae]CAD7748440.1 hypothetical protein LMG31885_45870 [Xanthomonas hydrangeae]